MLGRQIMALEHRQTEQTRSLIRNLLLSGIMYFVIGIVLVALSLFES